MAKTKEQQTLKEVKPAFKIKSFLELLEKKLGAAQDALLKHQNKDGHWVFELEADATIPAEYVLLEHYVDRIDPEKEEKIAKYLRDRQEEHGGWPLYYDGKFDLSASVKAYYALKVIGDSPDAPHMRKAREAILRHGGAERSNVFTRILLALYGQVPWDAVPVMPVELILLPRKAFVSIWNMSYWSRTVIAPLLVLAALRPLAINPKNVHIDELFRTRPSKIKDWIRGPYRSWWGYAFKALDVVLRKVEPFFPRRTRRRAIGKAIAFIEERLSEGGLGAIYPAMANVVMMYRALGVKDNHPLAREAWDSIQDLLVEKNEEIYCQPCVSPVWDTGLASVALIEVFDGNDTVLKEETKKHLIEAAEWLKERQILDVRGDWAVNTAKDIEPGGWAFQYENPYYPDVDDTAVVGIFLHRLDAKKNSFAIERARKWVKGLQSTNGGWGAFDIDNDLDILNQTPFADHGALLDPPTADVSARCVSFLAQVGKDEDIQSLERGIAYLRKEQEADGSWFGRWGTNYIYGTWSVLSAFNAAELPHDDAAIQKAVRWLEKVQREDGGWGEDCASYEGAEPGSYRRSLPTQTAWALLALMAVGEVHSEVVQRGIDYLLSTQNENGEWEESFHNAVGFPRVFYLRYHGYKHFFPLLALSRFKNLKENDIKSTSWGI
ncbi:squalene--hopene cyclase [Acetobacteraceae bacterium]|nr:squalene--hopene cyclase [Acetobacteraceae bacterium]